ncbi:LysE family translocator [Bradyrhizobium sp. RDI18]|uniref:LysE family translocator n=1 Tax=Bradyrhizobium sp. RDI18 TaxID=3367400 RepID=UPI003710FAF0
MVEGFLFWPLVLFSSAMSFTPGPNVIMVTSTAANFGYRRAIPHILGITFGFGVMIVVLGAGIAGAMLAEPRIHAVLKYAGAAYLLYLAWRIARSRGSADGSTRDRPIGFVEAALFQWVNPKGWMSALGALAAFTTAAGNPVVETTLILLVLDGAVFLSVALWAAFGVAVGRFLVNPSVRRVFNWSMAGLLVLSLIPVLID